MDIKSLFDEAKSEILSGKHPLIDIDSSIKHAYLTGLAIIAATNAKDEFTKVEKQYFDKMAISLNLPDELYKNALTTGKNPDKSVIKTIVETIDQRYMQFLFLIDAYMLAHIDGEINETENHIINSFIQFFKFTNDNCQILKELMSAIEKNDIENFNLLIDEVIGIEENMKKDILKYYFSETYEKYLKELELKEQCLKEAADKEKKLKEEINRLENEKNEITKKRNDIINTVNNAINAFRKINMDVDIDGIELVDIPSPKKEINRLDNEYAKCQKKIDSIVKEIADFKKS